MSDIARDLLDWYDRHRRELPWRAPPGERPGPYRVWLSEIMLQQTTVATVTGYFDDFVARWPRIEDLAAAELDEVLHAWAGLGYYARARNLHKCAVAVTERHGGRFPADEAALRALPGIGPYTAAAIAAIAFDLPTTPVDGNIERVTTRLHAISTPLPTAKPEIAAAAATLTPTGRPGDFAQAMMDLGATVCTPTSPACAICPLRPHCRAAAVGAPTAYPVKAAKRAKPTRRGMAFWIVRPDGAVLLRRRPEKGLLGGLMEVPSTPWREEAWSDGAAAEAAPVDASWTHTGNTVRHTFTHFHLELDLWRAAVDRRTAERLDGIWVRPEQFGEHALPTVMKKVMRAALEAAET